MSNTTRYSRAQLVWMVVLFAVGVAVLVVLPLALGMNAEPGPECTGTPLTDSACFR